MERSAADKMIEVRSEPMQWLKWIVPILLLNGSPLVAQHAGHERARQDTTLRQDTTRRGMRQDTAKRGEPRMAEVLGISMAREGSGTSWLPDSTPMYMRHAQFGPWDLMLHGNVFAQYIDDGSDRGSAQFGSINWVMGMARRKVAGGQMMLRGMLSAEPWTVGECGYPDLLATGESCNGKPLHDRQHPHDLFMELAAWYQREINDHLAIEVYGGPVAEPALGPTAYPHRISAFPNPIAPITHHWIDATHITFGAITAAIFSRRWKLEGSLFNGREPDEDRADIDLASLTSYSGRISFLPTPRWSLQVSAARLDDAEFPHEPGGDRVDVTRYTASAIYHRRVAKRAFLAATVAYGHNIEEGDGTSAILSEASLTFAERHLVSARFEWVEKTGADLALDDPDLEHDLFRLSKGSAAYTYQFPSVWGWKPGVGVGGSINFIPEDLEPFYGTQHPLGLLVFVSLRPALMHSTMVRESPAEMHRH